MDKQNGGFVFRAAQFVILTSSFLGSEARADEQRIPGCSAVLPDTIAKVELSDIKTVTSGQWTFRRGVFHVTNLGGQLIVLAGTKQDGIFEIEEPSSWEMIRAGGAWQGTNGIPGTFMTPPDKLVIPSHGVGSFETSIEPSLPDWDPGTTFYIIIYAMGHDACMVSAGFVLQPKAILEHTALDAAGKVDAEVCPGKAFDQDVVVRFVKKQKFDFGPSADSRPKDLGIMEIENHRQTSITLYGERHGDYFYIPDSRVLVEQHLKSGEWEAGSPMLPARVRYPMDTLTVPAGGKASFVAEVDPGPLYAGWDRNDRAVLADGEAEVCAASQEIYFPPDPNCGCTGSAH